MNDTSMSEELEEEMDLLSAMYPDECALSGKRLVFGPVDGLELELDLPPNFPLTGAPSLASVTGISAMDVVALLAELFGDGTSSGDGERARLFELIQRVRDAAAEGADAAQPVPPPPAPQPSLAADDFDFEEFCREGDAELSALRIATEGEAVPPAKLRKKAKQKLAKERAAAEMKAAAATGGAGHRQCAAGGEGGDEGEQDEEGSMWAGMALGHEEAALLRTQLPPSLEAAGFTRYGEHCFMHEQEPHCVVEILALGVTPRAGVRRGAAVVATAGGVREEDLAEFVAMELAALRPAEFGKQLLEGISMMRHMAGEAADASGEAEEGGGGGGGGAPHQAGQLDFDERCRQKLPPPDEIHAHPRWADGALRIDAGRRLHIFTWGDALMKKAALKARKSQFDVNAKPLNGRGGGADTKHNALQDQRIMLNVAASLADDRGMTMLVQTLRKIEAEDLHCISVFCSKGRHRSVSMAVLLQMGYYPQATIEHLTIR